MVEKITQYIFEMRNPNIQRLTRHLLNKHQNEFFRLSSSDKEPSRVRIWTSLSRRIDA